MSPYVPPTTRRALFDGTIVPRAKAEGILAERHVVHSRAEFFRVLEHVAKVTQTYGRAPVIHLEAHGDRTGVELAGSPAEIIPWAALAPTFTRINRSCRMNLLVVAAMCHGVHMNDILRPIDQAPAAAILATTNTIDEDLLLDAMRRFYWNFLSPPHDLGAALRAARAEVAGTPVDILLLSAELWFCQVMQEYFATANAAESREARAARLLDRFYQGRIPDVRESMERRQAILQDLDDDEFWYNHYRQTFLMLDLFPENEVRFRLGYEDCIGLPSN